MSDIIHEIIGEIGILHKKLIDSKKIENVNEVFEFIQNYETEVKEHYLNLLLQYYFQNNDLKNLKEVLLVGAKFDMNFDDVQHAFTKIVSNDENVIEFMEDSVVFIKDTKLEEPLKTIYEYYQNNEEFRTYLEQSIETIKKNRYVCAFCFKNQDKEYSKFFLNEDLLESLKRDLPYILK